MTAEGIVIRGHGKSFIVRHNGTDIPCEIRGRVKHHTDGTSPVAVGDEVSISVASHGTGMIESVAPRRSMFFRPAKGSESKKQVIAANIDRLGVVASVREPELKPGLIDRFLIAAAIGDLEPIIIFNKTDLGKPDDFDEIVNDYHRIGLETFCLSALTGDSTEKLEKALVGHKTIFAGHSGVGKTTILNRLIPGLNRKVGRISDYSRKGRHTTPLVELFELPGGGYLLDSPGLKVLELWKVDRNDLDGFYPEMSDFIPHCRFTACSHTHEPDCAVKKAVSNGKISRFRYRSYLSIYESL